MASSYRVLVRVFLCAVVLVSMFPPLVAAQSTIAGRYIVVLRSDTADPAAAAATIGKRAHTTIKVDQVYTSALKGFAGRFPQEDVSTLLQDPQVVSIDVDQPVSIAAQTLPTGVDRIDADLNPTAAIDGVDTRVNLDIAVLDTGSGPHSDLNIVGGKDCTGIGSYNDDNGHGSHVAGIIGALDNGIGVVGVAPGVRIWSVKVLDSQGNGSFSNIICGIDWVTANKSTISVANMSLGGIGTAGSSCGSSSLRLAICNSVNGGVTYVAAAGNSHVNVNTFVPAAFPEVISVSALADFNGQPGGGAAATCRADVDDGIAGYSNFGAGVTIAAPGDCILSTWLSNGYNTISGTSMAAPHVTGAAALYIAVNGRVSPSSVKAGLRAAREQMHMTGDTDGVDEGVVHAGPFNHVNQPPTATITAPAANAVVSGNVPIKIQASDPDGPTTDLKVHYRFDDTGSFVATTYNSTSGKFEATFDSKKLTDGSHTLKARATDLNGAQGFSPAITISVQNGNAPPVARAGNDQSLGDPDGDGFATAALDGSASTDTNGTIVSYAWAEGSTALATGPTPSVSLSVGVHTITLTVTDNGGATGTDTVIVTVVANKPPSAKAGSDQTLHDSGNDGVETVALNGSSSTDPDGSIASYVWSEGGTSIATGATASISLAVGAHTITLTVTDNGGATSSDDVIVTVVANQAPVADAGDDQTVHDAGNDGVESVTLDGSASTDADGTIVSYQWTEDGSVIASGATPTISVSTGVHTILLTVTDNDGATKSQTVVITVTSNQPPVARAGSDQTAGDPDGNGVATVSLDGSASSDDDGSIVSYVWSENGTTLATGSTASVTLGVGNHTILLTVTDNDGATGSNSVNIRVNANQPPAADAGADQSVTDTNGNGSEAISLAGTGSDGDGSIVSYQWFEGTTLIAQGKNATATLAVGTHTITLVVTDNGGATASDTLTVIVTVGTPAAPTNLKGSVQLSGTAKLTWTDNATNETGYRVYQSTDGGATWIVLKDNLASNTTSYTDPTRLTAGITYTYYVVAFNSAGESTPSNNVSLKR
jgi:subtilisin